MVARGDLGVELPLQEVPLVQKEIVEIGRRYAKPVIVATQVLDSMIVNPRPTRAETSDAANAILDGADALMLSGETSVGAYPAETVATMARIIEYTETRLDRIHAMDWVPKSRGGIVSQAAEQVANTLGAKYLVTFTESGDTARRMARLRSAVPVIAFSPLDETRNQLALSWGVQPLPGHDASHTDEMVDHTDRALVESGQVEKGDTVVIVFGAPPGTLGSTNSIRVHVVGEATRGEVRAFSGYDRDDDYGLG